MELLELRYCVGIANAGSLSRAASKLSVNQPTLSRQLNKLEAEMRTGLFYRHGRGVSLTEAGKRLFAVATSTLDQLSEIKNELRSHELDEIGEVALGIPPSIAASVGADLAVRFAAEYPKARLRIRDSVSGVLLEWIEAGRLDLAVLYDARRGTNTLSTPLLLEELFLIEPVGATGSGMAELSELAERTCVLPGVENGLRRVLDAACFTERVQPHVLIEIDCVAALKQLVEREVGCTVLPFDAVHQEVQEGRLVARPFQSPAMRAMLVIATPTHKLVTPLIRSVIRMLQAEVRRLTESGVLRGEARDLGAWNRGGVTEVDVGGEVA
jgi:LysR family nitrogen assimilation transcriptional regulator